MATINFNMVVVMTMVASMALCSSAIQHTVGGASGWHKPNDPYFYTDWAYKRVFTVGDDLLFNFVTGRHDVIEVSVDDYEQCKVTNPGFIIKEGPAKVNLHHIGDHYYICSFEGHCAAHQKLAITVIPPQDA